MKRLTALLVFVGLLVSFGLAQEYQQSPFLDDKDLPPVAERLPTNPAVIEPFGGQTNYGGTLRYGIGGTSPGWGGLWYLAGWENLVFWTPDYQDVRPNIAESWEVSDDAREYTFFLREGMKWSDGEPFTANDIMFYIEDVIMNRDLVPGRASAEWLPESTGDDLQVEMIDDYTIKFTFVEPYGAFLLKLATYEGRQLTWYPRHYLEQFHIDYNENVGELVAQEDGVDTWSQLFDKKAMGPIVDTLNYLEDPARPTLFPWNVTQPLGAGTQITLERNPYYFKVDPDGNQLPYIDRIVGTTFEDLETRTLSMLNGDIDAIKDPSAEDRAVFHRAVDEGRPLFIRYLTSDSGNTNSLHFNQTTQNETLAEVFANKDFRIGMSHAINRSEIIEVAHFGQGEPAQVSPLESSPVYNEQLATQFTEYDVALANEYLDKVLPEKGSNGFRLGPDGNRFNFALSVPSDLSFGTFYVQVAELLKSYFAEVGVDMQINSIPNDQFTEDIKSNNLQASLFTDGSGAGLGPVIDPTNFVPAHYHSHFGNGWYGWYENVKDRAQVEMPESALEERETYDETVLAASNTEEQVAEMQEVLQTAADDFYVLGISRPGELYYPFNERLGNIPETWIDGWLQGSHKILYPEQWVILEE